MIVNKKSKKTFNIKFNFWPTHTYLRPSTIVFFSEVLRDFIRYFQAPSKFLKFDSDKSFSQNQSVFSAIFLKVPSSFSDLFCHGFRALLARRLSFQYSLGLQIFLGCIFIPNQGMQRDKIHLWNGIQKAHHRITVQKSQKSRRSPSGCRKSWLLHRSTGSWTWRYWATTQLPW